MLADCRAFRLCKLTTMIDQQTPMQQAIALTYEVGASAPRVVAKGRGVIAQRIIEEAKAHNIFVHESKELVALLMQVNLDDQIPPALYAAIAEILAWLYRLENGIEINSVEANSIQINKLAPDSLVKTSTNLITL